MKAPRRMASPTSAKTACPLNADPLTDRSPVSLVCGPEGSGYPKTYAPGANQRYLFADDKHPSGAAHAIIASVITSTLAAPVQVSLAGEAGVDVAGVHRNAVSSERIADFALDRPVGSWRGYVTGGIGRHEPDVLPRLGETQANMQVLTLGANRRAGAELHWGAALSLARHDNDISGANLDSTVVLGSLHGTWRSGGLHLSGAVSGGRTSVDIERSIRLGPARRLERGSTSAAQFGAELDMGWLFGEPEALQHGPFLGFVWIDQKVKDYRESGRSSTSMNFSDFERDSLIARGGYQLTWRLGGGVRPYARVTYERELKERPHPGHRGIQHHARALYPPGFHAAAPVGEHRPWPDREIDRARARPRGLHRTLRRRLASGPPAVSPGAHRLLIRAPSPRFACPH